MKIHKIYSHLNGEEFLIARKPALWAEIQSVISKVDEASCKTKQSKERGRHGKFLYSPPALNAEFRRWFGQCNPPWEKDEFSYFVCEDEMTTRQIQNLPADEQRQRIEAAGFEALRTNNETDFVKERVAVEVQFGKYSFVAHDLYVKHLAFFAAGKIDVGIEILPMKSFAREMSSGPTFFEKDLSNILRQGRGVPGVPLVVLGVGA
ncbi:BglII/BstYI family type II restriction endonuclease [Ruegeria atlantica]|uniref:BglII/BstYI family type II restriction endonuclease n=1 Tax=Ruegeria atlantica TaxID=81569 RepID=UPI00147F0B2D|nr:BglII/BstYI family type II restriction endonuclease [Ruegeria atlantica]